MNTREEAEAVLYRVGYCAMTYYPDRPATEPGYSIDEDIDWCLAAAPRYASSPLLRTWVEHAIAHPEATRQDFAERIRALCEM